MCGVAGIERSHARAGEDHTKMLYIPPADHTIVANGSGSVYANGEFAGIRSEPLPAAPFHVRLKLLCRLTVYHHPPSIARQSACLTGQSVGFKQPEAYVYSGLKQALRLIVYGWQYRDLPV